MPAIQLQQGTIHYEEAGPPEGRPVVFVHGYIMGGDIWREVGEHLAGQGLRAIMPTWPMGSHREPMRPGADTTPRGVADLIAAFLEALGLEDVVLVGNDSGGALCQVVAAYHPERLGALVLTNCDAFENCPPGVFKALVKVAKLPGGLKAALAPLRTEAARRSPAGYGLLSHRGVERLAREWVRPVLDDGDVFEDVRRFTVGLDKELTLDAAARLPRFEKPVLLAWGTDDRLFPTADAHRLAAVLPDARVEEIDRARTLPMIDQPDRVANLIGEFAAAPQRSAAGQAMR